MAPALRPLERRDLEAVLPLARSAVPALELSRADLERNVFEDEGYDRSAVLVAAEDDTPIAFGCGTLRETSGHIKLLAVAPGARRCGHGTRLLRRLETALSHLGARRFLLDGAAPVYFQPGVPTTAKPALSFFDARGYRRIERRVSMTASISELDLDTGETVRRLAAEGVVVRPARPGDAGLFEPVARELSPHWATEARCSLRRHDSVTHIALVEGRLAAFATAGLWARNAFGPMGTRVPFRGRGLGALLLKRCLYDLRCGGVETVVISWVGPTQFYERVAGARATLHYEAFEKPDHADLTLPSLEST